jgi:phage-related protein
MKTLSVKFYKSQSGNEPVREWLKSLSKNDKTIIGQDIKTVEYGWPVGMPLVRKMDSHLWEIRSDITNKSIARVFFTVQDDCIVLLHGIIKKSQRTSLSDLKIAKDRRNQVLSVRR